MNITLEIFKKIDGKYESLNVIEGDNVIENALSNLYSATVLNSKLYRKVTDEYDYKTGTHTLTLYFKYPFMYASEYKYVYRGIKI